jgi:outer membrane protein OmpA-like peptidoglycan-associated protein
MHTLEKDGIFFHIQVHTDKDGVPDATDGCPSEPEDRDGYDDADGCPDPDNDHDGVNDDRDRCPNKAETNPRAADADGCPDVTVDTDGDGLEDKADKCPNEREDNDDWADDDGCPEWDNDKDGFKDDADACPFQAEVINGVEDQDGCPDQTPTAKVRVTADKIEILEKVYFETGKDVIKPQSYGILDQVATVMKSRADLKAVQVEGHTDDQGPDAKNMKLSQKRAEAVRSYLIREGVAAERLQAKGFGETLPIDSNGSENGRANNRRVEFRILSGPGAADLIE